MFDLRIRCATVENAERIVACLKASADPSVVRSVTGRPRAARQPGASTRPSPAKQATPATLTNLPKPMKLQDVEAALMSVQAKYGAADMRRPLAILARFGAGRVTDVKRSDYAGFIAACAAA